MATKFQSGFWISIRSDLDMVLIKFGPLQSFSMMGGWVCGKSVKSDYEAIPLDIEAYTLRVPPLRLECQNIKSLPTCVKSKVIFSSSSMVS